MKKLDTIGKSSIGLDENYAALISVVFGWLGGLVLFLIEKESQFVKFHAVQSMIAFGGAMVIITLIGWLPFIGGLISTLISFGVFVLWVVLLIKTYQGEWFEIPVIGEYAKKYSGMNNEE